MNKEIFQSVSIVFFILFIIFFSRTILFIWGADEVSAEVIEMRSFVSNNSEQYAPVFQYQDKEGNKKIYVSNIYSNPPRYTLGEKVGLYIALNKDKFIIKRNKVKRNKSNIRVKEKDFLKLYGLSIIFLFIAGFLFYCSHRIASQKANLQQAQNAFLMITDKLSSTPLRGNIHLRREIAYLMSGEIEFLILERNNTFIQSAGAAVEHYTGSHLFTTTIAIDSEQEIYDLFLEFKKSSTTLSPKYKWELIEL